MLIECIEKPKITDGQQCKGAINTFIYKIVVIVCNVDYLLLFVDINNFFMVGFLLACPSKEWTLWFIENSYQM